MAEQFEFKEYRRSITDEELLSDLRQVASALGLKKVSQSIYGNNGKYEYSIIINRFGSWNAALKKADLEISNEINVSDERLYKNLLNLWQHLGRQPKRSDLARKFSEFSQSPYKRRFKTWTNALKSFVAYANTSGSDAPVSNSNVDDKRRTGRDPSLRLRFKVLKRDNFGCKQCGASPAKKPSVELHVDHIKAWANGGETILENLQTLCSVCNIGKSNTE